MKIVSQFSDTRELVFGVCAIISVMVFALAGVATIFVYAIFDTVGIILLTTTIISAGAAVFFVILFLISIKQYNLANEALLSAGMKN